MKIKQMLLPLVCLVAPFAGQDEAARHKEWMDTAQDTKDELKDALDAKSRENSVKPAEKLVQLGEQEEAYWTKAKIEDAVKLAQRNLSASRTIAAAAKEEKFDQAIQAFADLESTCRACHDLHPEKRLAPSHQ